MYLQDLVGLRIKDARFLLGDIYLNLVDDVCISLIPMGDCCAHCYIENVSDADALFDSEVLAVEDLECNLSPAEEASQNDYNVIDCWGHRIKTTKGICNIEMRVSHNGYYGGRLEVSSSDGHSNYPMLKDF
jgi:hypothetical protein